jgi:Meckel syndrome type 1 protein
MPAPPLKKSEHPRAAAKPLSAPVPPLRAPASPAQPVPSAAPPAAFPADAAQREEKAQAAEAEAATGAAAAPHAPASDALDQAMSPRQRAGFAPAPSSSVELRRDLQLEPVDWLAHIRQLLHQGRRQQAIESLRLFHRAHPDWQLPDELRPLLD